MAEFETIFYEVSPDGTRAAIVEQDDRVAYFYLHAVNQDETAARRRPNLQACWVRNLVAGPIAFHVGEMEEGIPPILPRIHADHPDGLDPLEEARLGVIWYEEGNGVALTYDREVEAIIPPWSGVENFHGFARRCKSANQVCWPLPRDPQVADRLDQAKAFWKLWSQERTWERLQNQMLTIYEQSFGSHAAYYAIDGNKWPPRAIAEFHVNDQVVLISLGVAIRPQPTSLPTLHVPDEYRRIELGMVVSRNLAAGSKQRALQLLSSVANYPWYADCWIAPGHTYPFQSLAPKQATANGVDIAEKYARVIFTDDPQLDPAVGELKFHTDSIRILWFHPLDAEQIQTVEQMGAEAAIQELVQQKCVSWSDH